MAKPQCLVFILRHKGLKSLKFGSVHRPKSWLCSFSTGLAQNNLAASWPSTFLLYQPGLDPGSTSAKLDRSVPQTNQSVRQRVTVQNLHHESNPDWSHCSPPVLSLPPTSCYLSPFPLHLPDVCPCFRLRAALRNASTALKSFLDSNASRCRPARHLELVRHEAGATGALAPHR